MEFGALKAVSDMTDFAMPPVEKFVGSDGKFRSPQFAVHVAMRPWLWGRTIALAGNCTKASRALCEAIESYLAREKTSLSRCDGVIESPKQSLGGAPSVSHSSESHPR